MYKVIYYLILSIFSFSILGNEKIALQNLSIKIIKIQNLVVNDKVDNGQQLLRESEKLFSLINTLNKEKEILTRKNYRKEYFSLLNSLKNFKIQLNQYSKSLKIYRKKSLTLKNIKSSNEKILLTGLKKDYQDKKEILLQNSSLKNSIYLQKKLDMIPPHAKLEWPIKIIATVLLLLFILLLSFKNHFSAFIFSTKSVLYLAKILYKKGNSEYKDQAINSEIIDYISIISAKLKNSIQNIYGISDMIKSTKLNEKQAAYVNTISDSIGDINNVILDLIDFSRITSKDMAIRPSIFNLPSFIEGIMDEYEPIARKKGIELNFNISKDTPKKLKSDGQKLRRILTSIISNATKYTTEGSVILNIESELISEKICELTINITDTGIGMSDEKLKSVFQLSKDGNNFGVGLIVAKKIVNLMGGEIEIKSEEGIGTSIVITMVSYYLPHDENEDFMPAESFNILLAEDELMNQKIVSKILEFLGHKVTIAKNGQEAVDLVANHRFDLILMDIMMPVMDGVEASKKILKKHKSDAPTIVALTGKDSQKDIELFSQIGIKECLSKPIQKDILKNTIENLRKEQSNAA